MHVVVIKISCVRYMIWSIRSDYHQHAYFHQKLFEIDIKFCILILNEPSSLQLMPRCSSWLTFVPSIFDANMKMMTAWTRGSSFFFLLRLPSSSIFQSYEHSGKVEVFFLAVSSADNLLIACHFFALSWACRLHAVSRVHSHALHLKRATKVSFKDQRNFLRPQAQKV